MNKVGNRNRESFFALVGRHPDRLAHLVRHELAYYEAVGDLQPNELDLEDVLGSMAGMTEVWPRVLARRHVDGLTGRALAEAAGLLEEHVERVLEQATEYLRQRLSTPVIG